MIKYWLAGAMVMTMMSGVALAQSASGSLSARDVMGKRLLDANGAAIGRIESATEQLATVRTNDGQKIQVEMAKLSLGNGPHTVIEEGNSDAEQLNTQEAKDLNAQ